MFKENRINFKVESIDDALKRGIKIQTSFVSERVNKRNEQKFILASTPTEHQKKVRNDLELLRFLKRKR